MGCLGSKPEKYPLEERKINSSKPTELPKTQPIIVQQEVVHQPSANVHPIQIEPNNIKQQEKQKQKAGDKAHLQHLQKRFGDSHQTVQGDKHLNVKKEQDELNKSGKPQYEITKNNQNQLGVEQLKGPIDQSSVNIKVSDDKQELRGLQMNKTPPKQQNQVKQNSNQKEVKVADDKGGSLIDEQKKKLQSINKKINEDTQKLIESVEINEGKVKSSKTKQPKKDAEQVIIDEVDKLMQEDISINDKKSGKKTPNQSNSIQKLHIDQIKPIIPNTVEKQPKKQDHVIEHQKKVQVDFLDNLALSEVSMNSKLIKNKQPIESQGYAVENNPKLVNPQNDMCSQQILEPLCTFYFKLPLIQIQPRILA